MRADITASAGSQQSPGPLPLAASVGIMRGRKLRTAAVFPIQAGKPGVCDWHHQGRNLTLSD
jgi:hypothetical protein